MIDEIIERLRINLESEDGSFQVSVATVEQLSDEEVYHTTDTILCLNGVSALPARREKRWRIFLPLSKRDMTS